MCANWLYKYKPSKMAALMPIFNPRKANNRPHDIRNVTIDGIKIIKYKGY